MADIIPITTYIDITVRDSVPVSFADPKKGLIFTTGDFDPDYVRVYSGSDPLGDIEDEWGADSNLYKAASAYFGQSPKPDTLLVGIYSETIPATVYGGTTNSLEDIKAITNGAMQITTGEGIFSLIDLDFSSINSLNDALVILQTAAKAQGIDAPIRFGPTGFEIYGGTAFPTDIANLAATSGFLTGGTPDALASFQAITNGGFKFNLDGVATAVGGIILGNTQAVLTGGATPAAPGTISAADARIKLTITSIDYETGDIDFSGGVTTESEVVNLIQVAMNAASIPASIAFNGTVYVITTNNGGAVTISETVAPSTGTDLGALLKLDVAGGATAQNGIVAVASYAEAASRITAALTGATCVYDSTDNVFVLTSDATGVSSSVGFASTPDSGQDLSIPTSWRSVLGAIATAGKDAETPDATVEDLGLVATAVNARLEAAISGVLVQESLNNIFAANDGWMILTVTKEFREQNVAIAAWTQAHGDRVFIATDQTTNPSNPSNGGVALNFFNSQYTQSAALFHSKAYENEYLDAGVSGWLSALNFNLSGGYQNLTFKTIVGITPDSIGSPDGIKALNGNYYATAGAANQAVKNIVYPAFMADGLLITEKIANISIEKDLQNSAFRVLADTPNVPLSSRGTSLIKTALENQIESKWKLNGYVPESGGEYQDAAGNTIALPKGYSFNVFTTLDSRAAKEFLVDGVILKNGSVIKVTGAIQVQQAI